MSLYQQKSVPLPLKWSESIKFKDPKKNDTLGYIDSINRNETYTFVKASDAPLSISNVRMPYDCFTLDDIKTKGRGKLTMRIKINEPIWNALRGLDMCFSSFLIAHRDKLFSTADANFIGRDPSVISLKMSKPLAATTPTGEPIYDGYVTVRVNGRASEIEAVEIKDGPTGRYVSNVSWVDQTEPLPAAATRFSIVTGMSSSGHPIIRDTLPTNKAWAPGKSRVRYVGPGDINAKGAKLRYASMRPAYWSLAPGGSASLTLVLDHAIIENETASSEQAQAPAYAAPEGFELYDATHAETSSSSASAAFSFFSRPKIDGAGAGAALADDKRRRIEDQTPRPEIQARSMTAPGAPVRGRPSAASILAAGGGELGDEIDDEEEPPFAVRRRIQDGADAILAREYQQRMDREHEEMRRSSAFGAATQDRGEEEDD